MYSRVQQQRDIQKGRGGREGGKKEAGEGEGDCNVIDCRSHIRTFVPGSLEMHSHCGPTFAAELVTCQ